MVRVSTIEIMEQIGRLLAEYTERQVETYRVTGANVGLHSGELLVLSESTLANISEVFDAWESTRPKIVYSEEYKVRLVAEHRRRADERDRLTSFTGPVDGAERRPARGRGEHQADDR